MTECNESRFTFATHHGREVVAEFNGGTISSDGGALLLRETDRKMNLLQRLTGCFLDGRKPALVKHEVRQMLAQRVYGLALGYEDLNDHEQLRHDPLLRLMAGKMDPDSEPLAGKSTLNRMELGDGMPNRYKKITFWREAIDDLLLDVFVETHSSAPEQIVLDIDTTDFAFMASRRAASITAITITTAICRYMFLPASISYARACGGAISIPRPGAATRLSGS